MSVAVFSASELAAFEDVFEQTPEWSKWRRFAGTDGEDVIELEIAEVGRRPVHLAKRGEATFLANGIGEWGLAVSEDFPGLLEIVARMTRRRRRPHEADAA